MPSGNKAWLRKRKPRGVRPVRRLLILCEDTKSSRDYLGQFPFDPAQVQIECVGTGMNTDSLMLEAIRRKTAAEEARDPYEAVWVVFDKDDFPLKNFNRAFDLAAKHPTIHPCWSNECFELWHLLHFKLRTTAIGRKEISKELGALLKKPCDKADKAIFAILQPNLDKAIRNAQHLEYENGQRNEPQRNPSTRAHRLVIELLKHDPGNQATTKRLAAAPILAARGKPATRRRRIK